METEDAATTIPARTSGSAGGSEAAQDNGAAVAERLGAGVLLADPQSVRVDDLGYGGVPAPLSAAAQRHHAVGHVAVNEGQFARAVQAFSRAVAEAPESAKDYYALATAYANAGKQELAANALAHALVREFHLWSDYAHDPLLARLRGSSQHGRLEALAARLRQLHATARAHGTSTTVTWPSNGRGAGAQAGVLVGERFVPLAPRVWTTTAQYDAEPVADAYWDATSGRVVNIHATAHTHVELFTIELHDAATGRRLAHRDVLAEGRAVELDTTGRTLRLRFDGGAWQDLRGRTADDQEEPEQAPLRLTRAGIVAGRPVHRIAFTR